MILFLALADLGWAITEIVAFSIILHDPSKYSPLVSFIPTSFFSFMFSVLFLFLFFFLSKEILFVRYARQAGDCFNSLVVPP